ncbi:dTDP-glucose 4,6-dehydratase [Bradyrhizobium guangzhouense]|uniref:dTDP-glucose 4,6-dehydratase n=1 Tax=Bradyrhizobium guangzhouense TaxID=1325095 RepID=A0AAE5WZK9_9BRAD|nr:dTDP-glucose 4,6-dehydratase [Bradyrhizobium guangzhouense]QAU45936.1 dTDP-glucose 4,6-dehydratase [Bradyrhizobium guangzhouense]
MHKVLITGGAGFIGQNLVHAWRTARPEDGLVVLDAMTYAANIRSLEPLIASGSILFIKGDIRDAGMVRSLFDEHKFDRVLHLAAESHVDRSIVDPEAFLQTNVLGTFTLLKAALDCWRASDTMSQSRFLHVSTDEVYGSLKLTDPPFSESNPYRPNSPYAASKAASDHLVRSYVVTYGLPALITNCSNNYGPYQHPEKLIPLMIIHALEGKPLPIYGDGSNIRDWLHVSEHCRALMTIIERGSPGETYNVGGRSERNNRDVVGTICDLIDRAFAEDPALAARFPSCPAATKQSSHSLIRYVTDRPGHDHRYAIDSDKLAMKLGERCHITFEAGLDQTVHWYLDHQSWWDEIVTGGYKAWLDKNYSFRTAV